MSQSQFPVFPGQGWSVFKMPRFKTLVQTTTSGRELRASSWQNTIYDFRLTLPLLRDTATYNELRQLLEFFVARQGSFDEFLLVDPTDCSVTNQLVGTGDGFTTSFRLTRPIYSIVNEPVGAVTSLTYLTVGGSEEMLGTAFAYTGLNGYSGYNGIQFFVPPAPGQPIYATFTYAFRVRFKDDMTQLENFAQQLWTVQQIDLTGIAP